MPVYCVSDSDEKTILRVRDFWTSLVLIATSVFFLWKTSAIPLFGENRAGVSGADWYTSAAIVPLGLFSALLFLSCVLLLHAIRSGGASRAFSAIGIGWNAADVHRVSAIAVIMVGYIAGLVPRVDFIVSSGLVITALIFGFRGGTPQRMRLAALSVAGPAIFAFLAYWPQSLWTAKGDDWIALAVWIALTILIFRDAGTDKVHRFLPLIAVLVPLILVCAMAFGFRQNVPARGGLIFAQIEYHYYVTLRPIWRE